MSRLSARTIAISACLAMLAAVAATAETRATLVRVAGAVTITRKGGAGEEPALKGSQLGPGDRVRAGAGGKADLLVDGALKSLKANEEYAVADTASSWVGPLMAEMASLVGQTEEATAPGATRHTTGSVKLLSPIDTAVRQEPAVLKWEEAKEKGDFLVTIRDSLGEVKYKKPLAGTSVDLGQEHWTVSPGQRYIWSVAFRPEKPGAIAGAPSDAWFQLLPAAESRELADALTGLEKEMPGEKTGARLSLARALLLQKHQCVGDAMRALGEAVQQGGGDQWAAAASRRLRALGGKPAGPR
ncbi:MAG: hypothetical protein HY303_03810 [Candidatus Wallbacteria bacterium]|nr:hypothetical protein [Candidatus Wallbacteria bacterium]